MALWPYTGSNFIWPHIASLYGLVDQIGPVAYQKHA
jgi:hypothetical protein